MHKKTIPGRLPVVFLVAAFVLTACGGGGEEPTPTVSAEQIQTEAVATFAGFLTATAQAMPSETPTATSSPSPTAAETQPATNTAAPTAAQSGADACYSLSYVSDVTIPDDTEVAPGETMTKTWRVRNSGTCAWSAGFTFRFTGGEAMGGSTVTLGQAVAAGSETNLTVELTAPDSAGTYRGNWRMTTASGAYFGDEVYVQIVVEQGVATATQSASATTAPSATATDPAASATPSATVTSTATESS